MSLLQAEDWRAMKQDFPDGIADFEGLQSLRGEKGRLESWSVDKWQVDPDPSEPDQRATLEIVRGGKVGKAEFLIEGRDPTGYISYFEESAKVL